jgi:hypothetical protein
MTVAELKEALGKYPDDTRVYVDFTLEEGQEGEVDGIEPLIDPVSGKQGIKII